LENDEKAEAIYNLCQLMSGNQLNCIINNDVNVNQTRL